MDASQSRGGSSSSSSSSSSGGGANRRGSRGRGGGGSYRGARGGGGGGRGGSYRGGRGGGRGGGFRGGRGGGFQQRGIIQRYVSSVKPTELAVEQATQLSTVVYLPKNNRRLVAADGEAGNAFRQLCDDGDHFSPDDVRGFLPEERDNEALPAILPASLVPLDHARFGQLLRDVYRDLQTTGDALHFRIRLGTLRLPNLETLQARQFTVSDADVALRDNKGSFKGTFSDDVVFFEDAQLEDSEQEFERMKESVHELLTGAFGADAVEEGKRDLRNSLHFYTGDKMAQKFVVHYDPGTGEFHSEETISTERVSQRDIVVLGSPLDLRIALTRDTVGVEINVDETIRVLREHHLHDFETLVQTHHLPPEIRFNCVREEHHRTYCVSPSPEEREQWGADVLLVVLKHVVQKEPGQRTKYNINVTVYSTLINESRARRVLREGEELRPWSLNSVFHEALRALSLAYSLAPNLIL